MTFRRHLTSNKWEELRNEAMPVFIGIAIATALYMPFALFVFDRSFGTIFERAYFMLVGAAIVLLARHVK